MSIIKIADFRVSFPCPDCGLLIDVEFDRWDIDIYASSTGCGCCSPEIDAGLDVNCPGCGKRHEVEIRGS